MPPLEGNSLTIHFTPEDADLVRRCVLDDRQAEDMCRDIIIDDVRGASSLVVNSRLGCVPPVSFQSPEAAWESTLRSTMASAHKALMTKLKQVYQEDPEQVYAIRELRVQLHS